ncbi:hypothetical protein CYMTET_24488 [Cymbomonas tetramitiformis]|uniref:Tetratricopeptide repeat protein n=1 Tax=Cymbomonas tetramitiformis TaxID=36881 RepID=A0AAE0KZV6_9CHLO|nr:hypothetical protein CYMTET_24488 [Cymbomonas tetramitiformis]
MGWFMRKLREQLSEPGSSQGKVKMKLSYQLSTCAVSTVRDSSCRLRGPFKCSSRAAHAFTASQAHNTCREPSDAPLTAAWPTPLARRNLLFSGLAGLALPGPSAASECRAGYDMRKALSSIRSDLERGNLDAARLLAEEAAVCSADNEYTLRSQVYTDLGDMYLQSGFVQKAQAAYTTAVGLDGGNARAYYGRARTLESTADWKAAIADYSAVVAIRPDPTTLSNRAYAYEELGDWSAAANDFHEAAELFLQRRQSALSVIMRVQEGLSAYEAGQVTRARAIIEKSVRQRYSSDLRVALAMIYWSSDDYEKAENMWAEACAIEDSTCFKYHDRRWVYGERKWKPKLGSVLEDFLALRPASRS